MPGGNGGSETRRSLRLEGSTWPSPLSTCRPAWLRTRTELKAGSRLSEPDSDLRRGRFDGAPGPGVGAVEERMGFHAGRPGQDEGDDDETRAAPGRPPFVTAG